MRARFAIAAIVIAGCAAYDPIQPNTCGNGVVEDGEDCDVVGGPDAAGCVACRWSCASTTCPEGWGCGRDGECRQGTGTYKERGAPSDEDVSEFVLADLDGDDRL